MEIYFVYILTNQHHTVLYVGFTDEVFRRTGEHKEKILPGFTIRYNINKLVYYEEFDDPEEAKKKRETVKTI